MKLKTKGIYADGMVIQRNTLNCIFGETEKKADVELKFRGKTYNTKADDTGNWKIEFNSEEAGGPFEMEISSGSEKITFKDVFVGEVWVSSGQSNAQLQMTRMRFSYPEEFELPENQNIRMITIPITWSFDGEKDSVENPTWVCANSEKLLQMAGVGYFFAKKINAELGVPVGIITCAQGGSPISSWLNKKSLQEMEKNEYLTRLSYYEKPENVENKKKELAESQKKWNDLLYGTDAGSKESWEKLPYSKTDSTWTDCKIPGYIENFNSAGFVWIKKEVVLTSVQAAHFNEKTTWIWLGTIIDADKVWVNGVEVGETGYSYPPRRYVIPTETLVEGENTITVRLQKNSSYGKIRFYEEKPYYLFTEDVKICPVAIRNVEIVDCDASPVKIPPEKNLEDGKECICIAGNWKMKVGTKVEDAPAGMFFEWCPTALYNSMLSPCFNYAIKGAMWYQGESDAGRYGEYKPLLEKLITLWREKFVYASKKMPFVIVQLPNWSDGNGEESAVVFSDWPYLREAQAKAVEETENTGIAVTIDAGEWNDLHPEKKKTSGTRAAMAALRIAYEKDFKPSPVFESYTKNAEGFAVKFNTFGAELRAFAIKENSNGKAADLSKTGEEVFGFSLLSCKGETKSCIELKAKLVSKDEVFVYLPAEKTEGELVELRYLWAMSPAPVNLYSNEKLPVMPFRIELK